MSDTNLNAFKLELQELRGRISNLQGQESQLLNQIRAEEPDFEKPAKESKTDSSETPKSTPVKEQTAPKGKIKVS